MRVKLVQEVLFAWREAERVLEELAPEDPDHARIVEAATKLRTAYQLLTDPVEEATSITMGAIERTLDRALALLGSVEARLADQQLGRAEPQSA
jgi:hypothetical protein